jgi:hypothetical protein
VKELPCDAEIDSIVSIFSNEQGIDYFVTISMEYMNCGGNDGVLIYINVSCIVFAT